MERLIKNFLWVFFTLILILPIVESQTLVNISSDSFVSYEHFNASTGATCLGSLNFNPYTNYDLNNSIVIHYDRTGADGGSGADIEAFFKFNVTNLQNKIISNLTFNGIISNNDCGSQTSYKPFYYLNNDSWDGSTITGNNAPSGSQLVNIFNITGFVGGIFKTKNLINSSILINDIYTDNFTSFTIKRLIAPPGSCTGVGADVCIYSNQTSTKPYLNVTLVDYLPGFITQTDSQNIWFDFESGSYSNSSFSEDDFQYDVKNNQIIPSQPATFFRRYEDNTNTTLGTVDCNAVSTSAYTYNRQSNINPPSTPPLYDVYCFNLSYQHNGHNFYGAIKVINNSNIRYSASCILNDCNDLDFYWSMYSPQFTTFGEYTLDPDPPVANQNLTVQWTTSQNSRGWVQFRYNNTGTGNWSPYFYSYDENQTYRTYHTTTINGQYILPFYYEFTLNGNLTDATNITSDTYNFTITGSGPPATYVTENTTVVSVVKNLVANGFCADETTCYFFVAALIIGSFSIFAVAVGGMRLGIVAFISLTLAWGLTGYLQVGVVLPILVMAALVIAKLIGKLWG